MSDWQRGVNPNLVVYHSKKLGLKITRRPDSPIFWLMRGNDTLGSYPSLEKAQEAALHV